jgi:inhibitor of KinA sporulation pathway (predicted exonuclease)
LVAAYDPQQKAALADFDSYVKPAKGALWSQHTINVHEIEPTQRRIKEASGLEEVWNCLLQYFEELLQGARRASSLHGEARHAMLSGCFELRRKPTMAFCPFQNTYPTSVIRDKSSITTKVAVCVQKECLDLIVPKCGAM